jgi:hypothetical protein
LEVRPDPLPGDPGHAEISTLTYQNRKSPLVRRQMVLVATDLCLRVEGPFPSGND